MLHPGIAQPSGYEEGRLQWWERTGRLATSAVKQRDWQRAVELTRLSIALRPEWTKGYLCLARLLHRLGRAEEAADMLLQGADACKSDKAAVQLMHRERATLLDEPCPAAARVRQAGLLELPSELLVALARALNSASSSALLQTCHTLALLKTQFSLAQPSQLALRSYCESVHGISELKLAKSPNKHNRVWCMASPLPSAFVAAFEAKASGSTMTAQLTDDILRYEWQLAWPGNVKLAWEERFVTVMLSKTFQAGTFGTSPNLLVVPRELRGISHCPSVSAASQCYSHSASACTLRVLCAL